MNWNTSTLTGAWSFELKSFEPAALLVFSSSPAPPHNQQLWCNVRRCPKQLLSIPFPSLPNYGAAGEEGLRNSGNSICCYLTRLWKSQARSTLRIFASITMSVGSIISAWHSCGRNCAFISIVYLAGEGMRTAGIRCSCINTFCLYKIHPHWEHSARTGSRDSRIEAHLAGPSLEEHLAKEGLCLPIQLSSAAQ